MNELIAQFEMEQANMSTSVSDTINTINKALTPFSNKQAHIDIMNSITDEV
mgnify:CR=1 FL=1|jgi:hypothetical protein